MKVQVFVPVARHHLTEPLHPLRQQYNLNDTAAMTYNAEQGVYEKTINLKQGFYSYTYVTKDAGNRNATASVEQTDGNYWETENDYTILIYYRSLAGRHDELVGVANINSLNSRR